MSKSIFKYPLDTFQAVITMPKDAEVLCVQVQHSVPCLWAKVDTEPVFLVERRFAIIGTGHEVPDNAIRYIGTYQEAGGMFVWHVFEVELS